MEVLNDGPAPLISAMCRSIGLTSTINQMLDWDERQCKLSPGFRVEAMIINLLMGRRPLYRLDEFFEYMDVSKLFGPMISPCDITDDSIGRALDKLAEANPAEVYATVALKAACQEGVAVNVIHADTTSVSVQGAYDDYDDTPLLLTYGYSKDHRPDLKQFMYGLGVTRDQVPVIGEVMNGNTSDQTWNMKLIEKLRKRLGSVTDVVYVADSSVVGGPNLEVIARENLRMISRLPATFKLEGILKDRAWADGEWVQVGELSKRKGAASYQIQSYQDELAGRPYRFIVVHSSKLDGRKTKAIDRRLEKAESALEEACAKLASREFACEPDAHEAWAEFVKDNSHSCFTLNYEVGEESRSRKRPRGRPAKDYLPEQETFLTIRPGFARSHQAIKEKKSRASCFVLLTNIPDSDDWPDNAILIEYKEQTVVEQSFAFMKNPKLVGPIYLKKPERVNALAYVLLMALLIYSLVQRRARLSLENEEQPMMISGKKTTFTPTGQRVLQHFEGMTVIKYANDARKFPSNLRVPERILGFLGFTKDIFLRFMPP